MTPAGELRWGRREGEALLATWSVYSPEIRTEMGSTALLVGGRWYFFDPIPLAPSGYQELLACGEPGGIVLTNGNHERDALAWAQAGPGAPLPIYARAEAGFTFPTRGMAELPRELRVFPFDGAGPGEAAVAHASGVLILGDALIHLDETGFAFLPERYCSDPAAMRDALRGLAAVEPEVITFAHGAPLWDDAARRLRERVL